MKRVAVVGSGVAGTAAALAAARAGARVQLVAGSPGASSLAGGALDWDDWQTNPPRRALGGEAEMAFSALDFGSLPDAGVLVATTAGIVRPAAGADHALLDLDRTGRGAILVPRCDHPTWDAPALARAWGDSPLASARALTFVALDVPLARYRDERLVGDVEIAARHDEDTRLAWLAERLREVLARNPGFVGVMLPPWLGARRSRAEALSQIVGVRCGEAVVGLASASGARFEHARDRALGAAGVGVVATWARAVSPTAGTWRVALEEGDALEADAVVIAAGGLVAGGLVYSPGASSNAAELPADARPTLHAG
ncbi:MAG TPA: FAD-dependent oxidoreductase, partial [Polyangiaceae bacterium]